MSQQKLVQPTLTAKQSNRPAPRTAQHLENMTMQAIEILLSDARGIYIPRDFVEGFDVTKWNLDPDSWAVQTCADPDAPD